MRLGLLWRTRPIIVGAIRREGLSVLLGRAWHGRLRHYEHSRWIDRWVVGDHRRMHGYIRREWDSVASEIGLLRLLLGLCLLRDRRHSTCILIHALRRRGRLRLMLLVLLVMGLLLMRLRLLVNLRLLMRLLGLMVDLRLLHIHPVIMHTEAIVKVPVHRIASRRRIL